MVLVETVNLLKSFASNKHHTIDQIYSQFAQNVQLYDNLAFHENAHWPHFTQ